MLRVNGTHDSKTGEHNLLFPTQTYTGHKLDCNHNLVAIAGKTGQCTKIIRQI